MHCAPNGPSATLIQAYLAFAATADRVGFSAKEIRRGAFRSKSTAVLSGAFEGTSYELEMLQDADGSSELDVSKEPKLRSGDPLANDILSCVYGLNFEINQQLSTFTNVEINELMEKLGEHIIEIKLGVDVVLSEKLGYHIAGQPSVAFSNDGQSTVIASRGPVVPQRVTTYLEDPFILPPGATVEMKIKGGKTWTTTDDLVIRPYLPAWFAFRGQRPAPGKGTVHRLSRAFADTGALMKSLASV